MATTHRESDIGLTPELLRHAERVLPTCKTLSDAEAELGGEWSEHRGRDRKAACITWGLFDGFRGRPQPTSMTLQEGVSQDLLALYRQAAEAGRRLVGEVGKCS